MHRPPPRLPHAFAAAALVTTLALGVGAPSTAHASVWDVFGMSARGTAMAGAMGANKSASHAGLFYNPATIGLRKKTHLGIALQLVAPMLGIDQAEDSTRGALLPKTNLGITLGAVFPLGGKIDDRVTLGVAVFLPLLEFTRMETIDPVTPHFYYYQNLPDALVIAGGIGVQLFDWLSVGVGTQILASFRGSLELDVTLGERRVSHRSLDGEVLGEIAPTVGVWGEPYPGFTLGFTYRDDLSLDFELPLSINIVELGLLDVQASGRALYTPEQLNFAAAYHFPADIVDLLVAFDLTWMRFSLAPSPALSVQATLDDRGLQGMEMGDVLVDLETIDSPLGASDVFVPRIGVEYRLSDLLALQGGYFFRASPIPDQTGYTNYVDAATHTASVGASLTWPDPLEVHEHPVTLDAFLQLGVMQERSAQKRPAQDIERVGPWTASGVLWNFGAEFRHDF